MSRLTVSTKLNANLEVITTVRERDEKGRFTGKKAQFNLSSVKGFESARQLESKARHSENISKLQFKIRNVLSNNTDAKKYGYRQLVENMLSKGSLGDKDQARFMFVMEKIGPEGIDQFYKNNSEFFDDMMEFYNYSFDTQIMNNKQKFRKFLYGFTKEDATGKKRDIKGFFESVGWTGDEIDKELTKMFASDNSDLTTKQFQKKISNSNAIYKNYIDKHYYDVFEPVKDLATKPIKR